MCSSTLRNALDRPLRRAARRFAHFLLCAALAGCAAPVAAPPPPVKPTPRPPAVNRDLALLVTDGSPAFAGVAAEIRRRYTDRLDIYRLGDDGRLPASARERLRSSSAPIVVAIGLPAALAARELSDKRVVFCQVFNHEDAGLASPRTKGVSMMPPASEQLRVWKALSPSLKTVGLITGPRLTWLVDDAAAAAKQHGIELIHVEVGSDKETLYTYKRLSRRMQGLWLVPDNRVLSRDVLRELMVHSVKQGLQVLAFNHELLALGALLSAESRHADIAEQVVGRVRRAQEAGGLPGPDLAPLARQVLRINAVMAARLKLSIPRELARFTYRPS